MVMLKLLLVLIGIVGMTGQAVAESLTVTPFNLANVPTNVFNVGDTVVMKIEGDAEGAIANKIFGALNYDAGLTTFVSNSQSPQYANVGPLLHLDGYSYTFNQFQFT